MYKLKITRPWKIAGMKIFRFNIPDIGVGMGYFILAILIWFATLIYFVILLLFYGVILILTSFVPSRIFDLLVEQKLLPGYNYLYNCEAKN